MVAASTVVEPTGYIVRTAIIVGLLSLLALSACAAPGPVPEPVPSSTHSGAVSETPSPTGGQVSSVGSPSSSESAGSDSDVEAEPVPDPALVAVMECEPISDGTRLSHESRWGAVDWKDAVQVPVGEGLTPGELWWVTVSTIDGELGRARLTNADSLDDPTQAEWLIASEWQSSSKPTGMWKWFPYVEWEPKDRQRLHAATAKGYQCLGLNYPEQTISES